MVLGEQRPTVRPVRVLSSVAAVVTAGVFPVFAVGGLGVQLQSGLDFGTAQLGLGTAGFFAAAAAASRPMGWIVERIGARMGMRMASAGSALCLFGLALAQNTTWLLCVLVLAGLTNSLGQPASNLLIAQGVPAHRRGVGFAVKQSAIPAATLLAGVAVPAVALTVGWRWVFVAGGAIGLLASLAVPRLPEAERSKPAAGAGGPGLNRRALLLMAISGGLGSASANALGAFVTTTAVAVGFSPSAAGLVLSLASCAGLVVRLVSGVVADRFTPDLIRLITGMMLVGSVGFVLMAVGSPGLLLAGALIGFGAGWSWPGLFNFVVAKLAPDRVASATSFTQTGIYFGSSLGPLGFGFLAEHFGLTPAWLAAAAAIVLAAVLLPFARR